MQSRVDRAARVAERERFELSRPLRAYGISSAAPSTELGDRSGITVSNSRGSASLGPQLPLLLNRAIRWRLGWPQSPIRVISRPTDFRHVRELVNRLVKGVGIKMRRDARNVNYGPTLPQRPEGLGRASPRSEGYPDLSVICLSPTCHRVVVCRSCPRVICVITLPRSCVGLKLESGFRSA